MMLPIPAIDVRGGRCVRLLRGDFAAETVYGDPVEVATAFARAGAPAVHVVDLDAARTGEPANDAVVRAIARALDIPVQAGGGIRTTERASELLEAGVDRVVVGTLAVEDPRAARALAAAFPFRIVVGLDHRREVIEGAARRVVAIRGWETSGTLELAGALAALEGAPFAGAVVTDISRDGTLEGPDLDGYRYVLGLTDLPIIASGGVGALGDLRALQGLDSGGRRLSGVIIGRALLSGAFSVEEAVATCAA